MIYSLISVNIRDDIAQTEVTVRIDLFIAQTEAIAALHEPSGPRFHTVRFTLAILVHLIAITTEYIAIVVFDQVIPTIWTIL